MKFHSFLKPLLICIQIYSLSSKSTLLEMTGSIKKNALQILTPGSEPDAVHVVIDRHIVTGQNEQSTLTAVQNLILLYNQK